jgi:hypothetical protein
MKIKYVGKKPFAVDPVAGSGKTWNGNGDIQTMTDKQGEMLCKYPDQFEDANPDKSAEHLTGKYAAMNRAELMQECDNRSLEFIARTSKADLVAMLEAEDGAPENKDQEDGRQIDLDQATLDEQAWHDHERKDE